MSMREMRQASAGDWIMNTVSRNPEGLLLLAAGAALLMRSGRAQRDHAHSMGGSSFGKHGQAGRDGSEGLGKAAQRASAYVSEATDQVAETARSYASSAMDYAEEATQTAMDRSRRMAGQAQETAEYVVQEQPWAVALSGVIAGAVVASIFPATRLERRTLGEAGQHMRSAAGQMGEQLMEAGMHAGERLSEVAEERGLNAEGLKDAARDVGETFSSALSGESGQSTSPQRSRQGPAGSTQTGSGPQQRTTQNPQSRSRSQSSPSPGGTGKSQSSKRSEGDVSSDTGPNGGRR